MGLKNDEVEFIKRFLIHHEYGHLRDMFNGRPITFKTPDSELLRVDELLTTYYNNPRPFEIVADKYAINDLNLSLEEYKFCRNTCRGFLQRLGNDESFNYDYSRTKVWNTRHDLKRVMF